MQENNNEKNRAVASVSVAVFVFFMALSFFKFF
jgi:hypothetical protein